jgi:hypothetical protein
MVVVTECCEVMRVIPLSIVAFMALSLPGDRQLPVNAAAQTAYAASRMAEAGAAVNHRP